MLELQRSLLRYARDPSRYDEMFDERGNARPAAKAFLARLAEQPMGAVEARARFVRASIASDGITYNVYADPRGASRPWELDVVPLILGQDEWRFIERAVAQRAALLDRVLADLYGPQRLLAEGLVPPALVFGQRSFLLPAEGIVPPGGTFLHVLAVDLARAPDGRFWVIADRTRGPSGAGYALANRLTLSRELPDAFRELSVQRLAPFFARMQDALYRLSSARGEEPLVVLLTPGPYNETYFEHSFLARYLGFPLVEGQDLLVRGNQVFLKTLRGLRRVHGILRRLDDEYCDPVELRADSALGVPGLLSVVRAGNVVLANALGSGVLETPALAGFLPAVSERLLGEPLLMPSIATWWCGEAPALAHAVEHLDELVIKPTFPTIRRDPVFGHALGDEARAALVARMRAQPHAYVAQEWVRLSHAPTWGRDGEGLVSRAVTLRVFAVATESGYVVMPGALTRAAPTDHDVVSMQGGGTSKDTWVRSETPVPQISLRRPRLGVEDVVKSGVDIPSRVGENLFWVGRYAERCESVARLLRAALVRIADGAEDATAAAASIAACAAGLAILPPPADDGPPDDGARVPALLAAVSDPTLPGGLAANVMRLHAAANHVRERMSTDNWHVFNRLPGRLPGHERELGAALASLDEIMLSCVSLAGFAMDDMTRDESLHFLLLGRRLERLSHLAGVSAFVLELPARERDDALEWLLEAANSIVTYRARYRRAPELLPVVHLVLLDDTNPHSVSFQLRELSSGLARTAAELGGERAGAQLAVARDELVALPLARFDGEDVGALDEACLALAELLRAAQGAGFALSDELSRRYFSHAETPAPTGMGA